MLRVNRLSRANLYLLYIHSEIILLLYCSLKSNEPNIYVSSGSLLLLYFIVVKKHDGTREKGQLHPRVSPGRFRIFMGLRSEIGQFVTKLGSKKKTGLDVQTCSLLCLYLCIIRLLYWPDQSCDGWTCFDTSAKKRQTVVSFFFWISRRAFLYIH